MRGSYAGFIDTERSDLDAFREVLHRCPKRGSCIVLRLKKPRIGGL